ncbi:TIGR04255 family protein [Rhizobium sp. BT-175]|uniref:TIGR04255 family protein n=1 Tax=Rhizobium sp. BT-175 TaxID=2986929 RepID=UPI0022363F61|nr:TIGR04255 family protein [Rhizobium sp. BT-175]MCV9942972.1 TIGR04255 family protein [Rhizobium sp. BT-175]
MAEKYRVPPITESVVEFRFSTPVSFEAIEKREPKLKRNYPNVVSNIEVKANFSKSGMSGSQNPIGKKFTTRDQLQVMVVNADLLAIGQLAPYPGWDEFRERVKRDYLAHVEQFGRRQISRIGMRYINRIDVEAQTAEVQDYLNVYPTTPIKADGGMTFALQATQQLPNSKYGVTLQSASVEPPVPRNLSFLLDIDVFRAVDIPSRDDHILELLEEMRIIKNSIFESSVTDQARKLFN